MGGKNLRSGLYLVGSEGFSGVDVNDLGPGVGNWNTATSEDGPFGGLEVADRGGLSHTETCRKSRLL